MPLVTVELLPGRSQEKKDALARRIVQAMGEEMGVAPEAIWIKYGEVEAGDWYVADKSLAQLKREREAK